MKQDKNNLFSRYKKDAGACKDGYFGYELWLEKKLIEAETELKKLRLGDVSNSEVFEHYGKPFTSGRDLWDFLTAHYNFTLKT